MPRFAKPLTLREVAALPAGMHADGNNLYLHVSNTGARSWVFRYLAADGRRRDMGMGSLRLFGLEEARHEARKLCVGLRDGVDPLARRQKARARVERVTFGDIALAYMDAHKAEWAAGTLRQWNMSLRLHVLPKIGKLPIAEVDTDAIYRVLKPVWEKNANTGSTIRSRIELILGLATAKGLRQGDNPARWDSHLEFHLASPSKAATVEHRAALPFKETPDFMHRLRAIGNSKADALEFAILTCARIGEVLKAEWPEIDLQERVWIVPPGIRKPGKSIASRLATQL